MDAKVDGELEKGCAVMECGGSCRQVQALLIGTCVSQTVMTASRRNECSTVRVAFGAD